MLRRYPSTIDGSTLTLEYDEGEDARRLLRLEIVTGAVGLQVIVRERGRLRTLTVRVLPHQRRVRILPPDMTPEGKDARGLWDGPDLSLGTR